MLPLKNNFLTHIYHKGLLVYLFDIFVILEFSLITLSCFSVGASSEKIIMCDVLQSLSEQLVDIQIESNSECSKIEEILKPAEPCLHNMPLEVITYQIKF